MLCRLFFLAVLLLAVVNFTSPGRWTAAGDEVIIRDGYFKWVRKMGSIKHSVFRASKNNGKVYKTITVDKDPTKGFFDSVQKAIDSLPDINLHRVIIKVNEGLYKEKIVIPTTKAYITLLGAEADDTIIEWGDSADHVGKDGKPLGTFSSATVSVNSAYFVAKNITFKNTAPLPPSGASGKQGVALRISGDTAAFIGCKFYGGQDTLYDHVGRHYFRDCYIEGSVDFTFGNGLSLYEGCHLHAVTNRYGALTAQKRESMLEETGFSFVRCKVTGSGALYLGRAWDSFSRVVFAYTFMDSIITPPGWYNWGDLNRQMCKVTGSGALYLGRAWDSFSRVVFAYTFMDSIITPPGWYNWGDLNRQMTVFYGQYQCYGPGANFSGRVSWSRELTEEEAKPFISLAFIDGSEWLTY